MKNTLILLFLLSTIYSFAQNPEIEPYVKFLNKAEMKSAKDYILKKFETHDIVILCERDHSEISQYELIKEILSDDYFKENVKNVFTENGLINLQPEITEFLKIKDLDSVYVDKKLNEFQQNSTFWAFWERFNFHFLLRTIYDINNKSDYQISYFPSDVEFDWKKVKTVEEYTREQDFEIEPRDSIIAYNIINQYEKIKSINNRKALIILNYRHAFKIHTIRNNGELQQNAGKYLSGYFDNRAVSVLSNRPIFVKKEKDYVYELIQNGKWDAAFKQQNIENIGFDFENSVFGNDNFDMWNGMNDIKYKDVFDGFVFYNTIENHNLIEFYDGLISKDFEKEFFRRYKIQLEYFEDSASIKKLENKEFRENLIKELNTTRERKYPNIKHLVDNRDKYLND